MASLFFSWFWCHFFSVLQSVRQRLGAALTQKRLSFSFSVVFFSQESCRFQQVFLHSTNCLLYFCSFSLLQHQGKARLRFAIWISNVRLFVAHGVCFIAIKTNPWQAEEKMQQFILHTLYHLTLCLKVKVKCSLNLVFASWQQYYSSVTVCCSSGGPCLWTLKSTQSEKNTRLFWMNRKKPWSTAL